jgi:hypothetical protein
MLDLIKIDLSIIVFCLFVIYVLVMKDNKQIKKLLDLLT